MGICVLRKETKMQHLDACLVKKIKKTYIKLCFIIDFFGDYKKCNIFALKLNQFKNMDKLNRIKVVLVEKEKTGRWLAQQLGKSTCTVSKWCSNTTQPDLTTMKSIAKLLEVEMKDLLNEVEY